MLDFRILSSLAKVFQDEAPDAYLPLSSIDGFENETLSFQAAYHSEAPTYNQKYVRAVVDGIDPAAVRVRRIEQVPVALPTFLDADKNYLRYAPGLFPDILTDLKDTKLRAPFFQWQSVWIDVDASLIAPGAYSLTVRLVSEEDGETLASSPLLLNVRKGMLPKQTLIHTKWFHCDSLAEYYGVEALSEAHWRLIENYAALAVKRGINMILTPVHTPPLDTEVGHERLTVQLVDVTVTENGYAFGFEKLDRWVAMCRRVGVEYYEIAHFFSQWGAKCAPKIVATVDGVQKTIFGWDTPATGEAYTAFLKAYIPAILDEMDKLGVLDRCYFHISDEPSEEHLDNYLRAKAIVKPLLRGRPLMDALSNYAFYESGAVEKPIPGNNHIAPFIEHKVPGLWTYYCVGQYKDVSNLFIAMPSARTRVFAEQLFKFDIEGILQWGFNYYYARHSLFLIDPYRVTDGDSTWPAGDPFQVYPGRDGQPVESVRMMLIYEVLQDLRAMRLLESLTSKDFVVGLIEEHAERPITFFDYPISEEYILSLRKRVNEEIAKRY